MIETFDDKGSFFDCAKSSVLPKHFKNPDLPDEAC